LPYDRIQRTFFFGNVIKTIHLKEEDKQVITAVKDYIKSFALKSPLNTYGSKTDHSVSQLIVSVTELHVNSKYRKYEWAEGMSVEYEVGLLRLCFFFK